MSRGRWMRRRVITLLAVSTIFSRTRMLYATALVESGDNKLVPYSTSHLSFKMDVAHIKAMDSNIINIKKLSCILQAVPEPNIEHHSISFQTDGTNVSAIGGVLNKVGKDPMTNKVLYAYNANMSKDCTITTTTNEIKFTFSGENDLNDPLADFMLTAYIPTNGVYKAGIEQPIDVYKSNFVEPNLKLNFIVKDINIATIYQEPMMPSETEAEVPSIPVEKTIHLGQGLIEAIYCETPLIN